jgi:hypothetical protein
VADIFDQVAGRTWDWIAIVIFCSVLWGVIMMLLLRAAPQKRVFEGVVLDIARKVRRFGAARIIISVAVLVFLGTLAHAPWLVTTARTSHDLERHSFVERTEYSSVLNPPVGDGYDRSFKARIRFETLWLEWLAIAVVTAAAFQMRDS